MKLYTVPISPNCRRAEATVNYLGLDVEVISMDFLSGKLKSEDFLNLNPNGKVPTGGWSVQVVGIQCNHAVPGRQGLGG